MHYKMAQTSKNLLSLSKSFELIGSTVEQLNRGRGQVADAIRTVAYF